MLLTRFANTEWDAANAAGKPRVMPPSGFGAISRRSGRKPIIAAVNGICFGGGCELAVNCDMVVASRSATFALPEVKRGVIALAGALPRIVRTIGRQRAMEMALTGRTVSAEEAQQWGLVNKVIEDQGDGKEVVKAAVELAQMVAENSPDAVIVSREGVKMGWEGVGAEEGSRLLIESWYPKLLAGDNIKEGVRAFVEKRKPRWKPSSYRSPGVPDSRPYCRRAQHLLCERHSKFLQADSEQPLSRRLTPKCPSGSPLLTIHPRRT